MRDVFDFIISDRCDRFVRYENFLGIITGLSIYRLSGRGYVSFEYYRS